MTLAGRRRREVTLAGRRRREVTLAGRRRRGVTLAGRRRRGVNGDSCVIGVMVDGNVCVQCMMGDVVHG